MPLRSLIVPSSGRRAFALLWLLAPALAPPLQAAPVPIVRPIGTDAATAAYLLNFVRFTEWPYAARPANEDDPYVIGVSGNRALLDTLIRVVEGQHVRGHRVYIVRLKTVRDLATCHLAYFNPTPDDDGMDVLIPTALDELRDKPVLTVSPAADFIAQGGLVQLFLSDSLLRFDINGEAARRADLAINSRLMALARTVPSLP